MRVSGGKATGSAGPVLAGSLADVLLVAVGDDVAVIDCHGEGVTVTVPANLDPARRAALISPGRRASGGPDRRPARC